MLPAHCSMPALLSKVSDLSLSLYDSCLRIVPLCEFIYLAQWFGCESVPFDYRHDRFGW